MFINKERPLPASDDRDEVLREAHSLLNRSCSESCSSMAVKSFFEDQFQGQKLLAIVHCSDQTGVPISVMKQRSWVEHNVINNLLNANNVELAREVALNPQAVRDQHPELFKVAEDFVRSQS